jgi:hypothetical protein
MVKRIDTLIPRAGAFALAAVITLAVLVGIDRLARVDGASNGAADPRPVQADTGTGRKAAQRVGSVYCLKAAATLRAISRATSGLPSTSWMPAWRARASSEAET